MNFATRHPNLCLLISIVFAALAGFGMAHMTPV